MLNLLYFIVSYLYSNYQACHLTLVLESQKIDVKDLCHYENERNPIMKMWTYRVKYADDIWQNFLLSTLAKMCKRTFSEMIDYLRIRTIFCPLLQRMMTLKQFLFSIYMIVTVWCWKSRSSWLHVVVRCIYAYERSSAHFGVRLLENHFQIIFK